MKPTAKNCPRLNKNISNGVVFSHLEMVKLLEALPKRNRKLRVILSFNINVKLETSLNSYNSLGGVVNGLRGSKQFRIFDFFGGDNFIY